VADERRPAPNPQNLSELDPEKVAEEGIDPLTDTRTVAQTPTADEDIYPLPKAPDGSRTGDYDRTTGAAHPSADAGGDKGEGERGGREQGRHRDS
jgi:hypothetical protein